MKIQPNDTLLKLSNGNPGAATVLSLLNKEATTIDPDAFSGSLGTMLDLDTLEIYGSDIWVLYKDLCRSSIKHFIAVLRAHQLGFISPLTIKTSIFNRSPAILEPDTLLTRVQTALPNFAK